MNLIEIECESRWFRRGSNGERLWTRWITKLPSGSFKWAKFSGLLDDYKLFKEDPGTEHIICIFTTKCSLYFLIRVSSTQWLTHIVTALSQANVVKQCMWALPWRVGVSPSLQAVRTTKHITMSASACVLQSECRFVCEYPLNSGALLVMNKKQGLWCGRDANKHYIMYTRRTCPAYPLNWTESWCSNKVCSY
jgi:hypothetical protein